eukprot:CAMPEP_0169225816 /NCGR_PEP_ID=MMETSP1016-20121227/23407_1 /TAXON_ID=342587 /ORGANISM="Karlodinium micrum, Strain CCMP2283" /LENGTH=154 /DNA_ID=CAMNT_0009304363 /DNA_START=730 /DNA_END=1194 /DNA_ORIENTATION=-
MDDVPLMQVIGSTEELLHDNCCVSLLVLMASGNEINNLAANAQIHCQVIEIVVLEVINKLHEMRMIQSLHDGYLRTNCWFGADLVPQKLLDLLHCTNGSSNLVPSLEDFSKRAIPQQARCAIKMVSVNDVSSSTDILHEPIINAFHFHEPRAYV